MAADDLTGQVKEDPQNERLWAAWYRDLYPKITYSVYRLTRGDTDAAREIVQEAFTRFLMRGGLSKVVDHENTYRYLVTICRNVAIDRLRQIHRTASESEGKQDASTFDQATPDRELEMEQVIESLGHHDQRLLRLAVNGRSVSEIAAELGISYTSASVGLHRMKKRLQNLLS